ncbi:hypothetical protein [Salinibacterium sp. SWN167]|uniref:hypothetical protein n=1 Tax=Salinibacterium sp. SWN167 TaxID=2792054 RepID=UPI0018CCB089|nr:hypothetical protein [Salinibacterium sp. SWN167]MBH0082344.1 hypothetical protein [Salinibacterium sp. SWN167]
MLDNMSSFTTLAILLPVVLLLVGVLLGYGIIRAAVVGALRDHHKWLERRESKVNSQPQPVQQTDLRDFPYNHNV